MLFIATDIGVAVRRGSLFGPSGQKLLFKLLEVELGFQRITHVKTCPPCGVCRTGRKNRVSMGFQKTESKSGLGKEKAGFWWLV
jgi:hypothetical protein